MKNIYSLLIITVLLSACGGDNKKSVEDIIATQNLEQIRAKKASLDEQQQILIAELKQLESEIKKLDPQQKIPLITTFKAEEAIFNHFVELQGNVTTKQNVVINAEYGGLLKQIYVKEGQQVSKGQKLATIDDGGLGQQLAQLKIQTELAKTTFERQERLWNQKIGSEIQYLQTKANYEAQLQATNQLAKQLAKTIVRAPFSGTIDDIITDQGSVVAPGQSALFRIVNLKDMYIETDVPESYISSIKEGKTVDAEFSVLGKTITTKVSQVGDFINPANRTFKIQVPIPNKNESIKPNLTAKLKINDYTSDKAILIPQSIISENAKGEQYVYAVTDKNNDVAKAKRVIIETGKTQGDNIEVLSGLVNGNEIIDEGARSVKDGQDVKIIEIK
ncbi:efflux RND transporter periplasmic adaptor subunit [uncultured Algibacter sp.]|uniref:efflux RND transporter periplasmic adaptor subunit n=1 Tax=uncultured Algibacter sp. TaxID=298659 RepID=UPI0026211898|nr:efflux RND transporter periplasmic adaptor subunit [uncultured Algibacter sp.]